MSKLFGQNEIFCIFVPVKLIIRDKEFLKEKLCAGFSTRKIAKLPEISIDYRTILYYVHKYNLQEFMKYKKPIYNEDFFSTIDTREKAYILGYTIADGYVNNSVLEYGCALADKEILEFIGNQLNAKVREDLYMNKIKRRFPRARILVGNPKIIKDINKLIGGTKNDKTFPRIKKDLEHYMLLGFFDGDGCLTFGHRKDRNRLWQKINFTGSYKLLYAIQKLLCKIGATSSLHPKGNEKCFVLEVANLKDVKIILEYIYQDESFIVLHRKYNKYNALRLELGENEETTQKSTISCQAVSHETEGVETTGGKMGSLNNQLECPSL